MIFNHSKKSLFAFVFLLLLVRFLPINFAISQDSLGYGPFEIGDLYPLSQFHLTLIPESPAINEKNSGNIFSQFGWTNTVIWEKKAYRVDAELANLFIGGKYSITDSLEISITTNLQWQGGGIADHFIYEWHETFGLPQADRNNSAIKDDSFNISGRNQDGSTFRIKDKGFNFGDIVLGAKYLITKGGVNEPAISVSSFFRLPTATDYYQQDSIDIGLTLLGAKRFGRFIFYSGIGYVFIGDDFEQGINFYHHQGFTFVTVEYRLCEKVALISTFSGYTSIIDEIKKFPDYQTYLDLGIKADIFDNSTFAIAIRENPLPTDGTADISLILGYKLNFN